MVVNINVLAHNTLEFSYHVRKKQMILGYYIHTGTTSSCE